MVIITNLGVGGGTVLEGRGDVDRLAEEPHPDGWGRAPGELQGAPHCTVPVVSSKMVGLGEVANAFVGRASAGQLYGGVLDND